jgi:hypothetical protein
MTHEKYDVNSRTCRNFGQFFPKAAAAQHEKSLQRRANGICSVYRNTGGPKMDISKSLNVLMFCAAFAFVSAMVLGLIY